MATDQLGNCDGAVRAPLGAGDILCALSLNSLECILCLFMPYLY